MEKYLKECLDSILMQSYTELEVILVNDGSRDSSLEICKYYASKDERIIIYNQMNKGVSAARNAGISLSNGKYISFVDSDDYVDHRYLEILYRNIKNANADISICSWTHNLTGKLKDNEKNNIWNMEEAFYQYFKEHTIDGNICSKLYKKDILEGIQFDEKLKLGEDQIFIVQSIKKSNTIVFQNIPLYCYRIRNSSAMNSSVDSRYWDVVYRAEWLVSQAKDEYSNLNGLFRKEELNIYTVLLIMDIKSNTPDSNKIAQYVYPMIRNSKIDEFKKYSANYEFFRYFLIKYFTPFAKIAVKAKMLFTGRVRKRN